MATSRMALRKIRRTRQDEAPPQSRNFDSYREEYGTLLKTMRELGGDPAIDSLTEWIIDETKRTGRLPHPDSVQSQAKKVGDAQGIEIPPDSILDA